MSRKFVTSKSKAYCEAAKQFAHLHKQLERLKAAHWEYREGKLPLLRTKPVYK